MTARAREIRDASEEATAAEMRRIHESGELRHLYGQPLQLDDDPEWLATKILKKEGFSHPLIERSRELDEPRRAADAVIERLRRRYARLTRPGHLFSAEEAQAFNRARSEALADLERKLGSLNRAIRDFNLQAPDALQRNPLAIEHIVSGIAREIPALSFPPAPGDSSAARTSRWRRVRRRT
jgi:hypothetical protein